MVRLALIMSFLTCSHLLLSDVCSKRRRRCDGNLPCGLCSANNRDCTYSKQPAKRGPRRRRQGEETGNSPAEAAAQWGSSGDREPLGTCGGYPRFEDGSMAEDLLYFDGSGLPLFSLPLEGRQALVDEGLEQLLEGENPTKSKIAPDAAQSFVDSAFRSLESRDAMLPMNNYARISDDGPHLPTDDGMALTDSISSIRSNSDDSRLAVSRPGAQMGLIVSQIARPVSPESRPPMPFTAQLAHLISSDTLISSGATPTVTPIAERSEARTRATGAASPKNFKRPRSDGGWQMPLPGSKKEVEAMFRTMPSFRGHIPNPGSSVQVPLVRAPGIMDDLEPLPNQGTMTELINRFFEDLFVAVGHPKLPTSSAAPLTGTFSLSLRSYTSHLSLKPFISDRLIFFML